MTEVQKCPESECGSTDRETRYQITPPTEDNPRGTFCNNAWHYVPPEPSGTNDLTDLEIEVILGLCRGWMKTSSSEEIARHLGIEEGLVIKAAVDVHRRAGLTRSNLFAFIKTALN